MNEKEMAALLLQIKMILTGAHNIDKPTSAEERLDAALALIEKALSCFTQTEVATLTEYITHKTAAAVTATMQDDLAEILRAVGLSDSARPYSPHEVVQRDLLPCLRRLGELAIAADVFLVKISHVGGIEQIRREFIAALAKARGESDEAPTVARKGGAA